MSSIGIYKNNQIINKIVIKKRYQIKKEFQELFSDYYKEKNNLDLICECNNTFDVKMHLSKHSREDDTFININSNPGYADKHSTNCLFNKEVVSMNEHYYKLESDIFTTNILIDEKKTLNGDIIENDDEDQQRVTFRLNNEDDKDEDKKILIRHYNKYRNYTDFCNLILSEVLKNINYFQMDINSFERMIRRFIFIQKISHRGNFIEIKQFIYQPRKKPVYFEVKVIFEKDLREIRRQCKSQSYIDLIDNIIKNYTSPMLAIYFKKYYINSLFLIPVKLYVQEKENSKEIKNINDEIEKIKTTNDNYLRQLKDIKEKITKNNKEIKDLNDEIINLEEKLNNAKKNLIEIDKISTFSIIFWKKKKEKEEQKQKLLKELEIIYNRIDTLFKNKKTISNYTVNLDKDRKEIQKLFNELDLKNKKLKESLGNLPIEKSFKIDITKLKKDLNIG